MGPPLGEGVWEDPPESCPSEDIGGRGGDISTLGAWCGAAGGRYRQGRGLPPHLVPFLQDLLCSSELRAFVSGLVSPASAPLQAVVIVAAPFIPGLPLTSGTQKSHLLSENGVPQNPDSAPSAQL